jgi:hypothetical protein
MGFFKLDDVIEAYRLGYLKDKVADMDLNDLVLLRHEVEGYAQKHRRVDELQPMVEMLDFLIDERETSGRR